MPRSDAGMLLATPSLQKVAHLGGAVHSAGPRRAPTGLSFSNCSVKAILFLDYNELMRGQAEHRMNTGCVSEARGAAAVVLRGMRRPAS